MATAVLLTLAAAGQTNCDEGAGPLTKAAPSGMSPEAIIQRFATEESRMRQELAHYSWKRDISVQTLEGTQVTGEFRQVSSFQSVDGKAMEYVTFAPQSTLRSISMSKSDFDDINRSPFILTTEDLPQYSVIYDGQQHVDEINTYVFETAPKQIEKGKRYFQGRVWVEDRDLRIVKTCGKMVPDSIPQPTQSRKKKKRQEEENIAPTMVSYRELFGSNNWFPTYVRSDENLHFATGDIHIREIIKYTDYKRNDSGPTATLQGNQAKKQ